MARHKSLKPTYAERLQQELDCIASEFDTIVAGSGIEYVNPNRHGSGITFVGAADWGWKHSPPELEAARMSLLGRVRGWEPRFRLLFPHPTPEVKRRIKDDLKHLERWLVRPDNYDHSIPRDIATAKQKLAATIDDIRNLFALLPPDNYPTRLGGHHL
jgi:hypothetical protein